MGKKKDFEEMHVDFLNTKNVIKTCDFEYSPENEIKMFNHQMADDSLFEKLNKNKDECTEENFPNCKYASNGKCDVCLNIEDEDNFFPFEGKCIEECPAKHYRNTDNGKLPPCIKCEKGCLECEQDECKKCDAQEGMMLKNGKCVESCGEGFFNAKKNDSIECKQCSNRKCKVCENDKCSVCNNAFLIEEEGKLQCVDTCPKKQYGDISGEKCNDCVKGCDECKNATQCDKCTSPLVLIDDKICAAECPVGSAILNGKSGKKSCVECHDPHATKCEEDLHEESTECMKDYILYPVTKKCHKVADCEDSQFYLEKTNKCQNCPKACESCENASHCTACKHGHEPVNGICNTECPAKKTLIEGRCEDCKENAQNCDEDLETLKCIEGYFFNPEDKSCKKECAKCEKDSFLLEKDTISKCIDTCPEKMYGHENDAKCKNCSKGCKNCQSEDECEICDMPSVLLLNKSCSD